MAAILVRIRDRDGFDNKTNGLCMRPGDVIAVCPDDWSWGSEELVNPDWCILKMPGVDPESLRDMEMSAEDALGGLIAKRAKKLDLTAAVYETKLTERIVIVDIAKDQTDVLASKVAKEFAITVG